MGSRPNSTARRQRRLAPGLTETRAASGAPRAPDFVERDCPAIHAVETMPRDPRTTKNPAREFEAGNDREPLESVSSKPIRLTPPTRLGNVDRNRGP